MASSQDPSEGTGKSVADVLSSIRQTLHDEHLAAMAPPSSDTDSAEGDEDDDMLVLSPSMMEGLVQESQPDHHASQLDNSAHHPVNMGEDAALVQSSPIAHDDGILSVTDLRQIPLTEKAEHDMSGPLPIPLNDETMSDTSNSFAVLQKTLQDKYLREHEERKVAISHEGSLTVEDIVRQEVRVFLKKWLDAHLAGIVQAAVRKEVERLTQRGL